MRMRRQSIHLSRNPCEDRRIWRDSVNGALTVKLAYSSIQSGPSAANGLASWCFQLDDCLVSLYYPQSESFSLEIIAWNCPYFDGADWEGCGCAKLLSGL